MAEFMTVQFPNTAEGQRQKTQRLAQLDSEGWRIISETITAGEFNKEKACCFFLIFAPCAFLAGSKEGTINVTLRREQDTQDAARKEAGLDWKTRSMFDRYNVIDQADLHQVMAKRFNTSGKLRCDRSGGPSGKSKHHSLIAAPYVVGTAGFE